MNGLALQVQQVLGRDPHAGDLYLFRGARGDLIKIVWHDGIGMSLQSTEQRRAVRQELSAPLLADLERWLREQWPKLSRGNNLAKAMDDMLKRWPAETRFLDDGRICLSDNAAERAPRGIALGRKSWLFAGSDRGGQRAAAMYSLIVTAKLNDIDPQAGLADVLARIAEHPAQKIDELLPWNWRPRSAPQSRAA
jgi:transposase